MSASIDIPSSQICQPDYDSDPDSGSAYFDYYYYEYNYDDYCGDEAYCEYEYNNYTYVYYDITKLFGDCAKVLKFGRGELVVCL